MKKIFISVAVVTILGWHGTVHAEDYCDDWGEWQVLQYAYDLSTCTQSDIVADPHCATVDKNYTVIWHYTESGCSYIPSCKTCPSGYERQLDETGWTYDDVCYNPEYSETLAGMPIEIYRCVKTCTNCNDSDWAAYGTGYERYFHRTCVDGTCVSTARYRCAAGYYGSSTSGTSGCTKCPSSGGVAGQSEPGNNAVITKCYIPSGSKFSDSTGRWTYTGNCYYSK